MNFCVDNKRDLYVGVCYISSAYNTRLKSEAKLLLMARGLLIKLDIVDISTKSIYTPLVVLSSSSFLFTEYKVRLKQQ